MKRIHGTHGKSAELKLAEASMSREEVIDALTEDAEALEAVTGEREVQSRVMALHMRNAIRILKVALKV